MSLYHNSFHVEQIAHFCNETIISTINEHNPLKVLTVYFYTNMLIFSNVFHNERKRVPFRKYDICTVACEFIATRSRFQFYCDSTTESIFCFRFPNDIWICKWISKRKTVWCAYRNDVTASGRRDVKTEVKSLKIWRKWHSFTENTTRIQFLKDVYLNK